MATQFEIGKAYTNGRYDIMVVQNRTSKFVTVKFLNCIGYDGRVKIVTDSEGNEYVKIGTSRVTVSANRPAKDYDSLLEKDCIREVQ